VKRSQEAKLHDFVGEVEAAALSDRAELIDVIAAGIGSVIQHSRHSGRPMKTGGSL